MTKDGCRPPPRVVDLTHPIAAGMPFYPGTESPSVASAFTVADHGFAELRLTLLTHTGTHLDTPAHMLAGGPDLDAYPADRFVGPAAVVDARGLDDGVIRRDLLVAHAPAIARAAFVLLHTGWSDRWGQETYFSGYPVLDREAAGWLADHAGLRGVGVDAVSFDASGSVDYPVHRVLLGRGLVLIENLTNLAALGGRQALLCCLPLKVAQGDGAPVRAVALLD